MRQHRRKCAVLKNGQVQEQIEMLQYHSDDPPQLFDVGIICRNRMAVDLSKASLMFFKLAHGAYHRRFA